MEPLPLVSQSVDSGTFVTSSNIDLLNVLAQQAASAVNALPSNRDQLCITEVKAMVNYWPTVKLLNIKLEESLNQNSQIT